MKKFAVIVAAGSGTRMQSAIPKQFMELQGRPVLWYTLTAFLNAYEDLQVILVLSENYTEHGSEIVAATKAQQRIQVTTGGETRFQSVKNGLQLVPANSIVFVHDAARCLVPVELIHSCYEYAVKHGSAIPAINATDTIRIDNGHGPVLVDRNQVYIIQTPQTFQSDLLKPAFDQPYSQSFTDEASVAEAAGIRIHLVKGDPCNLKITNPIDLTVAASLLK